MEHFKHFLDRLKASHAARIAQQHMSEHSDAQLADIGLLRAELYDETLAEIADRRARSLLRTYR